MDVRKALPIVLDRSPTFSHLWTHPVALLSAAKRSSLETSTPALLTPDLVAKDERTMMLSVT